MSAADQLGPSARPARQLAQEVRIPLDEGVLAAAAAAAAASGSGGTGPSFTATCYDCGLFSETDVVGTVSFLVRDVLRLSKGWHETTCTLVSPDGERVVGHDGVATELRLAFFTDEGFTAKVARRSVEGPDPFRVAQSF